MNEMKSNEPYFMCDTYIWGLLSSEEVGVKSMFFLFFATGKNRHLSSIALID